MLVESGKICDGITKNTTAKITLQHGLIYDKMIKRFGIEQAQKYFAAQVDAVRRYDELCGRIDCNYEKRDAYVYSLDDAKKIECEANAFLKLGAKASFVTTTELPFSVAGAVKVEDQAQFNPLKFLFSLSKDLPIYENTKVVELKGNTAVTTWGKICAEKIIIATHFPFINKHGFYFLKMYQHRSYVLALENAPAIHGMYVDENEKGMSFRSYGDFMLIGGGSHRTGKRGGNWQELKEFAKKYYPKSNEVCRWATQDCMTLDGLPYIGRYSRYTADMYVITGFNKWGMCSAMAGAAILCDMVQDRKNEYASVFSPSRTILRPQLAINTCESILGLLTPITPRCPHLGCALKYNKQERSWDCPCHGSRFSETGELIDNPATDDKK